MENTWENYNVNSMRHKNWDYSNSGWYFITICTQSRINYFAKINNQKIQINKIGEIVDNYWKEIPIHFPFIELGEYIIMPNHIPGLLFINNQKYESRIPHNVNNISPKKGSISSVIRSFKGIVTKSIRQIDNNFKWQSGYYDVIIKDEISRLIIEQYIKENPEKWINSH